MMNREATSLRELYVEVAVVRAIEEIAEAVSSTEAEQEAERALEMQLKAAAHASYRRARGALATENEFNEMVWPSIDADLKREVKALMAMVK